MYSENVFNFPTNMTEQVTSVISVTGAILVPFKRGLRWGRNFEGQFGGRHKKRAVQRDTYVLIKRLFYDRGKVQKILTKLAGHITPRPRSELTHCGRVTQICVFNTVKLGTSASSP